VDSTVHVERPGGRELLAEMLPALGGRIQSVMLREPTLEDVFLSRTGHQFHDRGEETES
jgi:ABC-2 type transport system ATP-binding protein